MEPQNRKVYFIRHGQAEHNATRNFQIPDPKLTDLGISQAKAISLPREPTKIFVSPLRRTIQTALHGFDKTHHHKFQLLPLLQEREAGIKPCDTGSHKSILKEEFPELSSLFDTLDEDWFQPKIQAQERIIAAKQFLAKHIDANKHEVIAVVSHHGVYQLWTNSSYDIKNCEVVELEVDN